KRKGRPYSDAHRSKYRVIAELLKDRPANILEIGPGTGWGLKKLLKKNCIKKYLGIDAVTDCVNFLNKQFGSYSNIKIKNKDWIDYPVKKIKEYFSEDKVDFVLCIEVIEHNPYNLLEYLKFLKKIHRVTKRNLFYSTPNKEADNHGKLSHSESMELVLNTAFKSLGV
ncbi:MAG: class I SAM-dependent methyltransferase, partial [Nitrosopumilus sp.]